MKKPFTSLLMVMMLVTLPMTFCQAASDNGGSRLLCTLLESVECNGSGECTNLIAEDLGLPDSFIIDLEAKKILEATSVSLREARFNMRTSPEGLIILSGIDGMRGWSAVLSSNSSRLSLSISDESTGSLVFGSCRSD